MDITLSIQRIREQAATINAIGRFPPHIARLSAWHVQRLLREKAIELPKDANGVRVMFELTNNKALSRHSHQFICELLQNIKLPQMSRTEKQQANQWRNHEYLLDRNN